MVVPADDWQRNEDADLKQLQRLEHGALRDYFNDSQQSILPTQISLLQMVHGRPNSEFSFH